MYEYMCCYITQNTDITKLMHCDIVLKRVLVG